MPRVAVGSTNPVKIDAVRIAFEMLWPDLAWEIIGIPVASSVTRQPMSDRESITGARNRANRALRALDATFGVGLETGLQQFDEWWFDDGWVVVIDRSGYEGIGTTVRLAVPPPMLTLVAQGKEMGEASDELFQQENSKQSDGHLGLMTKNTLTRRKAYTDGVLVALARFVHPHLWRE